MTLQELESQAAPVVAATATPAPADAAFDDNDDQMLIDLHDGLLLLGKCKVLFQYLSDPDLCKTLTKRERDVMYKLAEKLQDYLDETEPLYS